MVFLYDDDNHNPDEAYEMGYEDGTQGTEHKPPCECLDCKAAYWHGYSDGSKGKKDKNNGREQ